MHQSRKSATLARALPLLLITEIMPVGPLTSDFQPLMSSTSTARPWPRWLPIAGWSILGLLGAALLISVATVMFGAVHGTEFCPQTFERRSYSYYELPLVRIQITGERHEDVTGDTEKSITTNNWITPDATAKKDWHVLVGSRGTRLRRPGDAGILMQYLDAAQDGNDRRWLRWSDDNKQLAAALWPAVQRLALRDMYLFVPDLFDLAKQIDDPSQLQRELDLLVAQKLAHLAQRLTALGKKAEADQVLEDAKSLDPTTAAPDPALQTPPSR